MQPNQQDPSQQNMTTSSGVNIPEYLHMDPITTDLPQKKYHYKFLITLILLLVVAGLVAGYIFIQSGRTPQDRFYIALEKQMQTTYLFREYDTNLKNPESSSHVLVESDFSDPVAPKSHVKYESKQTPTSSSGEDIIFNNQEYYSKLLSRKPTLPGVETNQWYRLLFSAADSSEVTYNLTDFDSRLSLNVSQGLLLTGNFNDTIRTKLMDYIRSKTVYTVIKSEEKESDGGGRVTDYSLAINRDALNALNKYAASLLGLTQYFTLSTTANRNEELKVTIDNNSNRLTRVAYKVGSNKNSPTFQKTILYIYPPKLQIEKPDNIKELPKAKAT